MGQTAIILQLIQIDSIIGASAFITTAIHIVLMFPVFSYAISCQHRPRTTILILAFSTGCTTYGLWLTYTWPFRNLFMITTLGLLAISQVIFLIQTFLIRRTNQRYP